MTRCQRSLRRLSLIFSLALSVVFLWSVNGYAYDKIVKIGLNYPRTGPYSVQGLDQIRATELAVNEINSNGGILEKKVKVVWRDSQSRVDTTISNVTDLIDNEQVKMVFGGSASNVALAAGRLCQEKRIIFFGTLTYSTATTGTHAHRHTFRECYNAWMGAKAIGGYLKKHFPAKQKKYFYITADYTWGDTTEASVRHFTGTKDKERHKGIKTSFPDATEKEFRKAILFAGMLKPDVLVLVLFGRNMSTAIRQVKILGLENKIQIIVPNLTLGMAQDGGPRVMQGVIGTLAWCWQVPYQYDYPKGKIFVESFVKRYNRYPSTSGACAYTILYQYKQAVERAGSFDSSSVIRSLEGHNYVSLKDEQMWRKFDHQSVQSVFTVKCKPEIDVIKDRFHLDYFEIIEKMTGEEAVRTREEWNALRLNSGMPIDLEKLPD
ncbi:amino acid/amide ABC transporter substrate-binding protein, HAAT family (TC 3.A.1.4.-) [Desulfobacula phenolica]|uniref:Amino acid/amide ABC transporter substrate-binding protein, HAAT family (TC 3.A.1.4.-) n=1 Tax=Desulfobacula phenolica TaxID=90732 RepID=A0A1H2DPG1_9BACT|nr:amino acid/amide ABC transporter substrate-binding protein, HAAT family (TC 3.A.1.4.-) [Desulfobacula phenolica]